MQQPLGKVSTESNLHDVRFGGAFADGKMVIMMQKRRRMISGKDSGDSSRDIGDRLWAPVARYREEMAR